MFTSQLLRILQSIQSNDDSVLNSAEQDTTMKENQNTTLFDDKSFGMDADSLSFKSKETYQLNDSKSDSNPLAVYVKSGEKCWNPFMDDFSMDNESETTGSPKKKTGDGLFYQVSTQQSDDAYLLYSDIEEKDKRQEYKDSINIEELTLSNGNEPGDSSLPCKAGSDLSVTESNLYTDEKVLDCELPELMVCYKEINYHVVRDICVDEGLPVEDKNPFGSSRNDQLDGSDASLMEKNRGVDEIGRQKESYGNLIAQEMKTLDDDTIKQCDSEDSVEMTGETDCGSNGYLNTNPLKEESFIDKTLPIQDSGTRSFLRSFMKSLDNEEDKVVQPPDQIQPGKEILGNLAASSTEAESEEAIEATSLLCNSKVDIQSGNITSNFNSLEPEKACIKTEQTKDTKDLSVDSGNSHDHKSTNAEMDTNSDYLSVDGKKVSPNNDGQAVDSYLPKHERKESGNVSVVSHLQHDEGESSFSAAGRLTYSGPIAYSGSLSLRSDASATSARSFAFPVLQSEWTSSPVRMAKADRKHFRKHKGWRSGLLCCRF